MKVGGTLLLAAELHRINAIDASSGYTTKRVRCIYPRQPVVAQVLQHVGIFSMLGEKRRPKVTDDTVKYWQVDTGSTVEGAAIASAMAGYKDHFSAPDRNRLYRALSEAMTNCRHHAYPDESPHQVRNWWIFSQLKDAKLTVGLCDLGIGIPNTLRSDAAGLLGPILKWIRDRRGTESDASMIQGAMVVGRSSTKAKHRGKGLRDMRRVIDALNGTLQIHSYRGAYEYRARAGEEPIECSRNFTRSMSIGGTLVVWQVPVQSATTP